LPLRLFGCPPFRSCCCCRCCKLWVAGGAAAALATCMLRVACRVAVGIYYRPDRTGHVVHHEVQPRARLERVLHKHTREALQTAARCHAAAAHWNGFRWIRYNRSESGGQRRGSAINDFCGSPICLFRYNSFALHCVVRAMVVCAYDTHCAVQCTHLQRDEERVVERAQDRVLLLFGSNEGTHQGTHSPGYSQGVITRVLTRVLTHQGTRQAYSSGTHEYSPGYSQGVFVRYS
jgi:hypothetical protein